MKPTWIIIALILIVLTLGYFQLQSCRDTTAARLTVAKDSISKKNDSLSVTTTKIIANDSLLRIHYRADTTTSRKVIDSLTDKVNAAQVQIENGKSQVKKILADLTTSVSSGDTASQLLDLTNLKRQMADLSDLMHFQNDTHDAKDSFFTEQLAYRDSVITEMGKTVDSLHVVILSKDSLMAASLSQLDVAIADLKKKKRVNILRTVGEVGLVVLLIFKQ